jgi:ABC-type dipeptide/oligopeptide/nickel transport system permease component
VLFVVFNLVVDLLYAWVDPRSASGALHDDYEKPS